jgi:hypothetical protein
MHGFAKAKSERDRAFGGAAEPTAPDAISGERPLSRSFEGHRAFG